MTDKPTDAEIVALMRDGNNCNYNDECEHIDFARAVLAKWGTPQPAPDCHHRPPCDECAALAAQGGK